MKRFFAILFSVTALVSATIFMSCSSDDSSSGGYNYSVLTAPQNVTTEAINSSSIQVSWNSVNGATGYQVYYSEYSSSSYASLLSTTTSTSTTATGLKPNTKYYFWVKAIKDTTMSDYSSYAYTTTKVASSSISNSESESSGTASTKLSAPTGVTATTASSSSIKLSWNSVSGATGYKVYYSEYSYSSSASFFDSTTSTSTTVTGLKANTKYYFWVKASNDTTISDYSSYDYATTKMNWTPPTTYQELTNFGYENRISINVDKGNVYWFRLYAFQSLSQYKYTIVFFDINYNTILLYSSDVVATYYDQNGNILKKNVDSGAWLGDPFYYRPSKSQYIYVKVECIRSGNFAICAERE